MNIPVIVCKTAFALLRVTDLNEEKVCSETDFKRTREPNAILSCRFQGEIYLGSGGIGPGGSERVTSLAGNGASFMRQSPGALPWTAATNLTKSFKSIYPVFNPFKFN
ncbi:Uncharacterised protein [uncultured archaeon]|nr:Uncharacterised protein [uncultured archaeon]